MNKEQQELLDDAYENYKNKTEIMMGHGFHGILLSQQEFINKCKTNPEFSERWGLKIEERELSWEERSKLLSTEQFYEFGFLSPFTDVIINYYLNQKNIPTKLITITYNDKTIDSYE